MLASHAWIQKRKITISVALVAIIALAILATGLHPISIPPLAGAFVVVAFAVALLSLYIPKPWQKRAASSNPHNVKKFQALAISLGVTSCIIAVFVVFYISFLSPGAKNRQLEGRVKGLGGEAACKRVYRFTGPPAPTMGSGGYITHCWVDFKGSSLSDKELAALVPDFAAVNLRVLDLRETEVTDLSVESISSFAGANWSGTLNVAGTKISAAGVSKLRSNFPFATITRD